MRASARSGKRHSIRTDYTLRMLGLEVRALPGSGLHHSQSYRSHLIAMLFAAAPLRRLPRLCNDQSNHSYHRVRLANGARQLGTVELPNVRMSVQDLAKGL